MTGIDEAKNEVGMSITGIFALRGQTLEKVSAGGRNEHTLPQMNAQRRETRERGEEAQKST